MEPKHSENYQSTAEVYVEKKYSTIQLIDLIDNVPEIANFESDEYSLRLTKNNFITCNNKMYEVRLFAFYLTNKSMTFAEFVKEKKIEHETLQPHTKHPVIQPLSYSIITDDVYLLISMLAV